MGGAHQAQDRHKTGKDEEKVAAKTQKRGWKPCNGVQHSREVPSPTDTSAKAQVTRSQQPLSEWGVVTTGKAACGKTAPVSGKRPQKGCICSKAQAGSLGVGTATCPHLMPLLGSG